MKTVTAREIQHGLSGYLERVSRGETLRITKHGKGMARLVPDEAEKPANKVEWPDFAARMKRRFPDGVPVGIPISEVLHKAREERF